MNFTFKDGFDNVDLHRILLENSKQTSVNAGEFFGQAVIFFHEFRRRIMTAKVEKDLNAA